MLQRASSLQRPPGPVPTISQSSATTGPPPHGELRPLGGGLASEQKPLSTSHTSPGVGPGAGGRGAGPGPSLRAT